MLNLLNAVKSLLKIEEAINQGVNDRAAWVFGNTVGLDSRRYLVILSNLADLSKIIPDDTNFGTNLDARALDKATGAAIPGKLLDSKKINRIYLIKVSPGKSPILSIPKQSTSEEQCVIEVMHINDLIATFLFGFSLSVLQKRSKDLLSPVKEILATDTSILVTPNLSEQPSGDRLDAVPVTLEWALQSSLHPFFVLFGVGGLGKSKFLEIFASNLFAGFREYKHSKLPILVPMKGIPAGATPDLAAHISTFDLFNKRTTADQIKSLILGGLLVVLLDAFDEHLKFSNRSDAIRFLTMLKTNYADSAKNADSKIILTSRDYYLTTDAIFEEILGSIAKRYTLQPFSQEQRERFIQINCKQKIGVDAVNEWCIALEKIVCKLGDGTDYLVGHSLFLLAFCQFICSLVKSNAIDADSTVKTPEDFERLESSSLFDKVIELINQREQNEKSTWEEAVWRDLDSKWHSSPFSATLQGRFFAQIAYNLHESKNYNRDPPKSIYDKGVSTNSVVHSALAKVIGIPTSRSNLEKEVANNVEQEAMQRIADFFRQHPLVDSNNSGFQEGSRFRFKYPTYMDYFVKQYLSARFGEIAEQIENGDLSEKASSDRIEQLIYELFEAEIMQRATNALFFLCWDNAQLEKFGIAMRALFSKPNCMESDLFRYLLTYVLVFSKLYADLRNKKIVVQNFCFDNQRVTELVRFEGQELNPYLVGLRLNFCSFGNILLKDTIFVDCDLLAITIHNLSFEGTVEFRNGNLMLVTDSESCDLERFMSPAGPRVIIRLVNVTIHEETLNGFEQLAQRYSNVELYKENIKVLDFDALVSSSGSSSAAKRLIDQFMRMARKHQRGFFGVYRAKLFGRSSVTSAKSTEVESYLVENGIIEVKDAEMFLIRDTEFMYHPEKRFGRPFALVEAYWKDHFDRLNQILSC